MPTQPPFRRRRLGRKLARLRADAGLTLDAAAEALFKTRSALHRMEKGETLVDVHLVKSMMDLYDHFDPDLVGQTVRARQKGWWTTFRIENQGYVDVETEATEVRDLSLLIVPGLLQTVGYMRALFEGHRLKRSAKWLENDIEVRRIRQRRLTDPDDPLRLHAIVNEAALRTVVGGPAVMREQLEHLCLVAELPNVTLQVVPSAVGILNGLASGFILLGFGEPREPDVLFIEYVTGAMHVEAEDELREARLTFADMAAKALGAVESVALIERILAE
ncbi:transcriptional regulator with XRE-family HTH domain [Saccharothrix tamanrassetensis]|uniref:Transcriptional regulator with XRE-family HTH domain n=1 Tax=Saccharothrix tamanrassetensis TaxID=1051531 RepID=A0A841CNB0_9PSEU|nr:helix-turn-helix transcriptional regulator [Saccharothrix tamanrassetensis]MBB5958799.1 transcriptional regulator with XRE-family HTH domain [Saccharothrix tamanrassetensis]